VNPNKGEVVAGLCLGAFGIYVISVARKLAYVSEFGPGPGFFPLWLGIGMVAFAACLVFARRGSEKRASGALGKTVVRALTGWLALMATLALLGRIGFVLSFVALAVFLVVVLDRRPALLAFAVAIGLAAVFQLIFVAALDVSLPTGPWGF
jgi:putative tricarboxylic transport membrane protein